MSLAEFSLPPVTLSIHSSFSRGPILRAAPFEERSDDMDSDSFPSTTLDRAGTRFDHAEPVTAYADGKEPLAGYTALMGVFGLFVGGLSAVLALTGRRLPKDRPAAADLLLLGTATHKLSRLLTKDVVTAPIRAPFVRLKGSAGEGELEEEPRGEGLRRALGELLVCPYCVGVWVATPLWFGLALAPRLTRFVTGILTTVTLADFTHRAYLKAKKWGDT